ncbi:MAG: nuclear transport factor 2 family protein [Desulfovibrionaceae bacterium]|nr:nuclear transport factor 2 family protein [Desulfovibrionaceae bacterium]
MKLPLIAATLLCLCCCAGNALARADLPEMYAAALVSNDTETLDSILAGNYWHISANGHIQDKEHFITNIKNRKMVIDQLRLSNARTSTYGNTKVVTGNALLRGTFGHPLPQGLVRFTMVTERGTQGEKVVLFQMTPVTPSKACPDGNCEIK